MNLNSISQLIQMTAWKNNSKLRTESENCSPVRKLSMEASLDIRGFYE